MNFLSALLGFIVVIGILVTIHELGHYLVMRWCGVRVLRFAFGFGKVLWSRRDRSGTEWALCLWPLGGYVKPLDMRESPEIADAHPAEAFDTQTVGKRIAMVSAGPVANFLLAIVLYWIVFLSGVTEWRPILAEPAVGTPAAVAGLKAGDVVTRVDGVPVDTWPMFQWRLLQAFSTEREVSLAVAVQIDQGTTRADRGVLLKLEPGQELGPTLLPALGLRLATPDFAPVIGEVQPESAAAEAGFLAGDRVTHVDGQSVDHWSDVVRSIRAHPGETLHVSILRDDRAYALLLTPRPTAERVTTRAANEASSSPIVIGRAGLGPMQDPAVLSAYRTRQEFGVYGALEAAVAETYDKSRFTLIMLGQILVGKASLENISGPVSIATAAGQTARMGPDAFLRFLAIVSLSLAVINLLPLPLLDGGHLMYYFVEIVTGNPVSAHLQSILQRFGVVLLGSLMFVALFNDFQRLLNW